MPRFAEPVANVTATVGKEALMACVVENLREYKVAWVKMITQTILSIHHKVVTQNKRVSITFNDHRSWFLHLRDVQETDRGWYMCQINTVPMTSQKGYLQVVGNEFMSLWKPPASTSCLTLESNSSSIGFRKKEKR
ncbi:hypothetical protein M8J76_013304 [Diaphorina citri]|nr:hypothetical protein M8J76_013304 [Diaphorina citri]